MKKTALSLVLAVFAMSGIAGAMEIAHNTAAPAIQASNNTFQIPDTVGSLTIRMVPLDTPIVVPPGGRFFYYGGVRNETPDVQIFDVWLMMDVPGIGIYGPGWMARDVELEGYGIVRTPRVRINVPNYAPAGDYTFWAFCGDYDDLVIDSTCFMFTVAANFNRGAAQEWNFGSWFNEDANELPSAVSISNNYPNPFNAETVISFDLPEAGQVSLEVYNLMGQKIATLIDGNMPAGQHSVTWDASQYSSGVYFYRLAAGEKVFTRRMTLLK
jgi:hypothetical protein